MSEQRRGEATVPSAAMTLDELARLQNAAPASDVHELAAEIWASDDELDVFLADLRASRNASLS